MTTSTHDQMPQDSGHDDENVTGETVAREHQGPEYPSNPIEVPALPPVAPEVDHTKRNSLIGGLAALSLVVGWGATKAFGGSNESAPTPAQTSATAEAVPGVTPPVQTTEVVPAPSPTDIPSPTETTQAPSTPATTEVPTNETDPTKFNPDKFKSVEADVFGTLSGGQQAAVGTAILKEYAPGSIAFVNPADIAALTEKQTISDSPEHILERINNQTVLAFGDIAYFNTDKLKNNVARNLIGTNFAKRLTGKIDATERNLDAQLESIFIGEKDSATPQDVAKIFSLKLKPGSPVLSAGCQIDAVAQKCIVLDTISGQGNNLHVSVAAVLDSNGGTRWQIVDFGKTIDDLPSTTNVHPK